MQGAGVVYCHVRSGYKGHSGHAMWNTQNIPGKSLQRFSIMLYTCQMA